MTSVILQWQPPAQPNGIITAYKIIAISTRQTVILNGSTTGFTFCGLQPGHQVNYTISASTVAGEGPTVNIAVTTSEKSEVVISRCVSEQSFTAYVVVPDRKQAKVPMQCFE